ncbi:MAG: patatin-like phospholipase family protein [Anaeromyxobacteraceae bacterium]
MRRAAALVLAAALAPGAARADPPAPARRHAEGASLVFAIAGGVSLGAYEAGVLHYGLLVTRANPGFARVRAITGASAGAVNGLISVITACGVEGTRPADGLFWQSWIPLGLNGLTAGSPGALAAFSRGALERSADAIEAAFALGLDSGCDVVLGVSVTRVTPREVRSAGGLITVPRIEEKFVVRIRGRGPGTAPSIRNYVDPDFPVAQLLLPELPDGEVPFRSLRELLLASAAFPVAFQPQPLAHCVYDPAGADAGPCTAARARSDLFVDGGILDNAPLRLAARLAGAGLVPEGSGRRWAPHPDFSRFALPDDVLFVYVSPEVPAWPGERPVASEGPPASLTPLLGRILDGFISTSRGKELLTLVEEHPEIGGRTLVPRRHFPTASRPLSAFLGFVETQFRVFDFYLGMYDARRMLEDVVGDARRRGEDAPPLHFPELPWEGERGEAKVIGGWRPLACMRAAVEHDPELAPACEEPSLEDFRILLQVSLDRLYSDCAKRTAAEAVGVRHDHCRAAMGGVPPPAVNGVHWPDGLEWQERVGEGEAGHALRLLSAHRFFFRDLGLARDQADEAMAAFRRRVGDVVARLASDQPAAERAAFSLASTLALNAVAWVPPRHTAWGLLGRDLELGYARELPSKRRTHARLHAAFQIDKVTQLISSDPVRPAFSALAGLEIQPGFLADYRTQTALLLRGGWLLTAADEGGQKPCLDPGRIAACSGPVVQAALAFTVLERIRAQLGYELHPRTRHRPSANWAVTPALGAQFSF